MTVEFWTVVETDVRTPSFPVIDDPITRLTSAFTGCPIGLAAPFPRQGNGAWRIVARYRSGTVAGSHGLPLLRDKRATALADARFKELPSA